MKRSKISFMFLVVLLIFAFGIPGFTEECTSVVRIDVSSCPMQGNTYTYSDNLPIVSTMTALGRIKKITITNSDPAVFQDVKFWEYGAGGGASVSSASVKCIWATSIGGKETTYVVGYSTTAIANAPITEDFGDRWSLIFVRGLNVTKSSPLSTIKVSVQSR